ncbi:U3 snoRNP protein [Gonapodya sp. JEL0774]|nr:U3 snoRNP protein [Gonapodya sp. JEL0774]
MAETVQHMLETTLPELHDLEARGLFSKAEIKAIVKARTDHEYRLARRVSRQVDYLRYIQYETNLESLRKKRKSRALALLKAKASKHASAEGNGAAAARDVSWKGSVSDHSIRQRLHHLYERMLKKFPANPALWLQYFDWAKSVGSSKILGRSYARAIQLHPTKPTFWILAASWEFEQNLNIAAARALLQRALRLNSDSQKLWLEYFRLELLYAEKLRERQRVLFREDLDAETQTDMETETSKRKAGDVEIEEEDRDDELMVIEEDRGVDLPALPEEAGVTSMTEIADPKNLGGKKNSREALKAVMKGAIAWTVYTKAIEAHPKHLQFRVEFAKVYRAFGDWTSKAQENIYQQIRSDFPSDPDAATALAERFLLDVEPSSLKYPFSLKNAVDAFQQTIKETPTTDTYSSFLHFLRSQLPLCPVPALVKYVRKTASEVFRSAVATGAVSEDSYLAWSALAKSPIDALEQGLKAFPKSQKLWTARLGLALDTKERDLNDGRIDLEMRDLFVRALKSGGTVQSSVWIRYLQALVCAVERGTDISKISLDGRGSGVGNHGVVKVNDKAGHDILEEHFLSAIRDIESHDEDSGALLEAYVKWGWLQGSAKGREVCDRLMRAKSRDVSFYATCISLELKFGETPINVLRHFRVSQDDSSDETNTEIIQLETDQFSGTVTHSPKSNSVDVRRVRRLFEDALAQQPLLEDLYVAYFDFEMNVARSAVTAANVAWRGSKVVSDKSHLERRLQTLRVS